MRQKHWKIPTHEDISCGGHFSTAEATMSPINSTNGANEADAADNRNHYARLR